MPVTVGHVKNITIADGTNTGIVRPSDWNSNHAVTLSLAGSEVVKVFAAGTNSMSSGTLSFSNLNGVSFGLDTNGVLTGSVNTNYQSAGAYLTTAALSDHSHGFATTTTNGSVIVVGTTNSNGVTVGVPQFLTTAQAPGAYLTTARASNDAIGLNTALTGNGVTWTVNSSGLSLSVPAFMVTSERGNYFATSNNTFANSTHTHGTNASLALTNINGTAASASNGLTLSLSVPEAADTWFATGNTIPGTATSGSFSNDNYNVSGAGIISVGLSSNTLVISASAAGGTINQTGPNIAANGSTVTSGTVVFSNFNGVSFGLNGQTMTASVGGNATMSQRFQYPPGGLSGLSAFGNGSFSINRMDVPDDLVATRLDHPIYMSVSSSATANTWGFVMTAIGAVYTKNVSTLSVLYSNSTVYGFTAASNTAGSTQMLGAAVRPVSIPLNVTMPPGEYYVGFGISTNTSSNGTATTANNITISAMGGPGFSSAVGWVGDFTATTNTSTGLYGGMGVYSAAISTVPPAVSISAINQTGSYYSRANIGLIFRNI